MTDTTNPMLLDPESPEWPDFAPAWASCADLDADGITFFRNWSIPSLFREGDPLLVIRVEESFARIPEGPWNVTSNGPRVATGLPGDFPLWTDYRHEQIAATLRGIADALDPREVTFTWTDAQ